MLVVQIILFCLLYILMVKFAVRDSGLNCLYFYPKDFLAEADRRGLADKDTVMKKGTRFMVPFCIILLVVLVAIIAFWNHITDFRTAYIQSVLFLVVVNWFDALVIDRLWVGHSKIWRIAGMEDVPYVKPWKTILVKRIAATVMYLIISLAVAGIVVLLG